MVSTPGSVRRGHFALEPPVLISWISVHDFLFVRWRPVAIYLLGLVRDQGVNFFKSLESLHGRIFRSASTASQLLNRIRRNSSTDKVEKVR